MLRILSALSVILFCVTAQAAGLDHVRLGMQAEREGKYRTAISHYDRAIASGRLKRQALAGTLYNRGLVKYRLGRTDAAIGDFSRAIKIAPRNGIAYYYRGLAYEKKKRHSRARRDYQLARKHGYRSARLSAKLKAHGAVASLGSGTKAHGSVWITRDRVNVRRGPSTRTARVQTLPKGARLVALGTKRSENWYHVSHKGRVVGYVYRPLLRPAR